ncbi:hypothetical protein ACLOJK_041299 [Asimina triloba]
MQRKEGEAAPAPAPAPTGCYKCGRPGHWSRDCPFTPSNSNSNPNPNPTLPNSSSSPSYSHSKPWTGPGPSADKSSSENPKKRLPRTRPKLTPDLLLSDDGLGYVLRHFPRAFKYRGRRHEVSDLRNLIGLYAQWHSRLLPYYSFEQFVHKAEQVGATRRVRPCRLKIKQMRRERGESENSIMTKISVELAVFKYFHGINGLDVLDYDTFLPYVEVALQFPTVVESAQSLCHVNIGVLLVYQMCVRELRDRVANGGDPTKLHEPPVELVTPEPGIEEATNVQGADLDTADPPGGSNGVEELFDEIYKKATEEPCQPLQNEVASAEPHLQHNSAETQNQIADSRGVDSNKARMSDEQKARMEANRLKALQKIAARSPSLRNGFPGIIAE